MNIKNRDTMFPVGAKVLSTDFGLGKISSVETLQTDGNDYYVIHCENNNSKIYFPTKDNKNIRQVSSKHEFEETLQILKSTRCLKKIDLKKERQIYFDRPLEKNSINNIVIRICELISTGDLIPREQKILDRLVETLELENSIIFELTLKESKEFILKFLI